MKRKRDESCSDESQNESEDSEELDDDEIENREEPAEDATDGSYTPANDTLNKIFTIAKHISESRKHYNDIVVLLNYMREDSSPDGRDTAAAVALCQVFCRLMALGLLSKIGEVSKEEDTILQWLRERLEEYEELLRGRILLEDSIAMKQVAALTLFMQLLKVKAKTAISFGSVEQDSRAFQKLVRAILSSKNAAPVIAELVKKYVAKHADLRLYTFVSIVREIELRDTLKLQNALRLLSSIEPVPDQDADVGALFINSQDKGTRKTYAVTAQRKQAQKAWMSVLGQPLNKSQRKKILDLMPRKIAPWFLQVELLMDFLTDAFNVGGSTSLMALSGLFHLMQQKNLDYPQFYTKLYSMLDGNILHSKHRSRFFRLLVTCLASTHLPAGLVASFIKKFARLCLFAPPSGIVIVVPLIYNLLQDHPSCRYMIQRESDDLDHSNYKWGDPFDMEEADPMTTDAIESSLWELEALQSHYHPNVAAIAKIISEPFTKAKYNLEDFLDHSYATMLDAGLSKKIKKAPEIEYEIPKKILTRHDPESGKQDSLIVRLWKFE